MVTSPHHLPVWEPVTFGSVFVASTLEQEIRFRSRQVWAPWRWHTDEP